MARSKGMFQPCDCIPIRRFTCDCIPISGFTGDDVGGGAPGGEDPHRAPDVRLIVSCACEVRAAAAQEEGAVGVAAILNLLAKPSNAPPCSSAAISAASDEPARPRSR
eukprot:CAMPEP_0172151988 /NCGR_PEP_ID=MMETSP1050-20130122/567_1 /TAXON_ID=233186 /ORGANISM="Cryptomonas curvata, Strain CCAP979/52" /LENGTH=107 /DNA_ID=CAMNT_0012820219 /DNA_START=754 /DNA_END=1075 /DNA_ORIENTATION=-